MKFVPSFDILSKNEFQPNIDLIWDEGWKGPVLNL